MISLLTALGGIAKSWLNNKKAEQQAKHEVKINTLKNRARLAQDEQQFNHEWEMANLEDKDKALRGISFVLFTAPFIIAIFFPEHVATYFKGSISHVPMWWQQTYVAITGGVWGISSLKNVAPEIAHALGKGVAKLPKIKLSQKSPGK